MVMRTASESSTKPASPRKATKPRPRDNVQRQHCGAAGKIDNCVVSVHLGYATPDLHALLDGELYLPAEKTWDQAPDRRREAGIPDHVTYRPKWRMALDQYRVRWPTACGSRG